jgi:hypothetical protein
MKRVQKIQPRRNSPMKTGKRRGGSKTPAGKIRLQRFRAGKGNEVENLYAAVQHWGGEVTVKCLGKGPAR